MSLLVNTKYRTEEEEIMDDFTINGKLLHDTLDTLATINTWLGGNGVTIDGIKIILKDQLKGEVFTIIDLGCGGGDILRAVAAFGQKEGYNFRLIGIDANKNAVDYAAQLSADFENITFKHIDIFSDEFRELKYDIVISTLFLHHFKEDDLMELLKVLISKANLGIVINDLQRHKISYYLFKLITVPVKNKMIIQDGLTSVLRGFKRKELEALSKQLKVSYQLKWKWAFRYQWIIIK